MDGEGHEGAAAMSLMDRFSGPVGRRLLIGELTEAKLVDHNAELAAEIAERAELLAVPPATTIIEQNGDDNDIYLIIAGKTDVVINGRLVQERGPGDHVGEMAAIQPAQPRSASIIAREDTVLVKLTEPNFLDLAGRHPQMYRAIARELARRLLKRNETIGVYRQKIRVFIISSVEALGVARTVQLAFEHDPFEVQVWTDGVFKVASYTVEALEEEVDRADFAIAIAHCDDLTAIRGQKWPTTRDNVIFELGLFMGRLGRKRAILMEPRDEDLKLPSDLTGITVIPYHYQPGAPALAALAPACTRLRCHIEELGANNG